MTQKTDVKAMMAKFQASGANIDETSSSTPCPKQPLHPPIPAVQRKPAFGNSSVNAVTIPPKPSLLKSTNRSESGLLETNLTKALASQFANSQEDSNSKPVFGNKPLKPFSQIQESKAFEPKSPVKNLPSSTSLFDPKPVFPKPETNAKPNWVKEQPTSPAPHKATSLQMKPTSSFKKLQQQKEEKTGLNTDTATKSSAQENTPFKPPSNFRNAQNMLNKAKDEKEEKTGWNTDTATKSSAQENTPFKPPSNFRNAQNMLNKAKDEKEEKTGWNTDTANKSSAQENTPFKPPSNFRNAQNMLNKAKDEKEEKTGWNTDTATKSSAQENTPFKPPSNFRNAQNMFTKGKDEDDQTNKLPFTSVPPPKPPASKKPSIKRKDPNDSPHTNDLNSDDASGPKKNPLPNIWGLGPAPAKPNRPQKVNLNRFKRSASSSSDDPGFKKTLPPTPLISHTNNQSSHVTQSQPPPALPSLPPRLIAPRIQQEDVYDDAEVVTSFPPPLPPSSGHPSQRGKEGNNGNDEDDDDEDGELYVDLDDRWEASESKQDKKIDKSEKEEKRRLEVEKKDQKEREKKEQEVKKRFKLVGPMEVIHQGKACTDCKGSKTDLSLKQGDPLDIIRVHGNPEGKWLARTSDGTIGYVKTTSVKIDFNTLKNRKNQQPYEPEVYDDIETLSSDNSVMKGSGAFPLSPTEDEGEIYDDCVDPNLGLSPTDAKSQPVRPKVFQRIFDLNRRPSSTKVVTQHSQSTAASNSDMLCDGSDDEIYDDVDSQSAPRPPPISSLPGTRSKSKGEEMDPKKQKKLEKEEKDFRKKFKYEGEIQVLYEVTIDPTLTNKKWNTKDLPVKAGEKLDVIVKAVDNKLICRNEEGKFGYVSICHIANDDDEEIYDDIGDDCIYDND